MEDCYFEIGPPHETLGFRTIDGMDVTLPPGRARIAKKVGGYSIAAGSQGPVEMSEADFDRLVAEGRLRPHA